MLSSNISGVYNCNLSFLQPLFHVLLFTPPLIRLLNDDQKERRMQVCQDIIEHLETEPDLLRRVTTGDETWIF